MKNRILQFTVLFFPILSCTAMENTRESHLLNLPSDIQNLIITNLIPAAKLPEVKINTDLKNLGFTCKHFYNITHDQAILNLKKKEIIASIQDQLKAQQITNDVLTHCNLNIQDENGMTALMHAAYQGNRDLALLLLNNGADISITDAQGHTVSKWVAKALHSKGMLGIHYDAAYLDNNGNFIQRPHDEIDDWIYFKSLGLTNENEEEVEEELTEGQAAAIEHLQEIYKMLKGQRSVQSKKLLNISRTQPQNNPPTASDNVTRAKQNCCLIQ